MSLCHCVTVSLCHCVTVSLCHCVTVSLCHCVTKDPDIDCQVRFSLKYLMDFAYNSVIFSANAAAEPFFSFFGHIEFKSSVSQSSSGGSPPYVLALPLVIGTSFHLQILTFQNCDF